MWSNRRGARLSTLAGMMAAASLYLSAQGTPQDAALDLRSSFKVDFPKGSPITLSALDLGESKAIPRGGTMVLDLHTALRLRNDAGKRVKGVTLLVLAQDVSPGGKGSVATPALDVAPGDEFSVRIDLRMLRPLTAGPGPLVQVTLDGVLFEDLSFYGENRLNSKRQLTVWELEARRDRQHLRHLLEAQGPEGLQREVLTAMSRITGRPLVDVQVVRRGTMPRAENAPATNYEMDREVKFSFLRLPNAPVELMAGAARISGDEAKAPRFQLRNRESKAIRHLEIGLALTDNNGREFLAGTVPYDEPLAGLASAQVKDEATLRIRNREGTRLLLEGMAGFVSNVEYVDGNYWIPSKADLSDRRIHALLPPSPEEQRLIQIYRKKGLQSLIEELKRP